MITRKAAFLIKGIRSLGLWGHSRIKKEVHSLRAVSSYSACCDIRHGPLGSSCILGELPSEIRRPEKGLGILQLHGSGCCEGVRESGLRLNDS